MTSKKKFGQFFYGHPLGGGMLKIEPGGARRILLSGPAIERDREATYVLADFFVIPECLDRESRRRPCESGHPEASKSSEYPRIRSGAGSQARNDAQSSHKEIRTIINS